MYCPSCGSNIPQNIKFCPKCGRNITNISVVNTNNTITKINSKKLIILTALIIIVLAGVYSLFIKKVAFNERDATKIINQYFISLKNSDYDAIKSMMTQNAQLSMSSREEFLRNIEEVSKVIDAVKALADIKYTISYVEESFYKYSSDTATAEFDIVIDSKIADLITKYIGSYIDTQYRIKVSYKYEDKKWLIDYIQYDY